jgi:hypothetical protein
MPPNLIDAHLPISACPNPHECMQYVIGQLDFVAYVANIGCDRPPASGQVLIGPWITVASARRWISWRSANSPAAILGPATAD